jgi:hypothetical protein
VLKDLQDCYRVLELPPGASLEEVRRSYHELVKVWHPDRFTTDSKLQRRAGEKLKDINLAYERICKIVDDEPHRQATPPKSPPGRRADPRPTHAAPADSWVSGNPIWHKHKRHKHKRKTTGFDMGCLGILLISFAILASWISGAWLLVPVFLVGFICYYQVKKILRSRRDSENIWK